ncbi:MAG TPA: hypothetical protein PLZ36_03985 [Armatimonadota bacterium]|nr:hypothetical protein [Armatimonadota bacterium]
MDELFQDEARATETAADPEWDLEVAMSFLDDIEKEFLRLLNSEKYFFGAHAVELLEQGDFILAMQRAKRAEKHGGDATAVHAAARELEGRIALSVESTKDEEEVKWRDRAIQAFTEAVQLEPTAMRWYRLGVAHRYIKDAIDCMRQAEALADGELKLKAAKMRDRYAAQ